MSASTDDPPVFPGPQAAEPLNTDSDLGRRLSDAMAGAGRLLLKAVLALILPLLILGLWALTAERGWIAQQILPAPAYVWESFLMVLESGELLEHTRHSLARVGWSLVLGGGVGLLLGFGMGLSATLRAYLLPTLRALAQIPVLGWIPLLIIFVGIEEPLKLWAVSLAVVVPVTFATLDGVANIQKALLEVGRVYRFSPLQVLHRIVLPASVPSLFGAVRQGVMQAWLTVIFVELLSSSEGLGYFMSQSRSLAQIDLVIAAMFVIGAIGLLIDLVLRVIESRLLRGRRTAY